MNFFVLTICFLFSAGYASLIFFYIKTWNSIPEISASKNSTPVFVSIIIAARNEEENIGHLLKALQNQAYPSADFEIIVVDDFSTDNTVGIVKGVNLENLVLIHSVNQQSSKKKAIEAGVRSAKGELIITTDADCIPDINWLKTITGFYKETDAFFIAAPVKFTHTNKLIQLFQAIDFLVLQGITGAVVQSKFHMMCNGANLAFKKNAFEQVNGYAGIDHIASGDDMLLMHKIWQLPGSKVFFLKSKGAIMKTLPMPDLKSFIQQRKRWASKTFVYNDYRIISVLAFVYLYNVFLFVLFIASVINPYLWLYFITGFLIKIIAEGTFFIRISEFYEEKGLLAYFILLQPVHIFYTIIIGLISQFGKYEWKGRRIK